MKDNKIILGHSPALFILFFTEMWERFSYYGMRALLVLFLVSAAGIGGWDWTRSEALQLYALYTGLVYITPIIGGFLADKFLGFRNAVIWGAFLMMLGHLSMALEGMSGSFFYLGLVLLIIGNGFFKPNISSIVGGIYADKEDKKDAAYTIFYMGINSGAFLGILLCGYIGEKEGWHYGFGLAGIFMFFGLLMFHFGQGIFGKVGLKPSRQKEKVVETHKPDQVVQKGVIYEKEKKVLKKIQNDRLLVIGILSFFTIFFWMAFEQAGGSMTIFARDYTDRILSGGMAHTFVIINALLAIVPLSIISWVLIKLGQATFKKYSLSNLFLNVSFILIWVVVLWMVTKELTTNAYEVSFVQTDKNITVNMIIRTDEPLTLNDKVHLLDVDKEGTYQYINENEASELEGIFTARVTQIKDNEVEIPASWFGVLNSLFIILFAPLFSYIWTHLYNPTASIKFALGLLLLGLGFGTLAFGTLDIPPGAKVASVSIGWLIIAYLFHTLGELCLSPVGLSYISKLAPPHLVSLMFGVFFLATAIANWLAGITGSWIDEISQTYSLSAFFSIYTFLPIIMGGVLIFITPFIKKKMHGIH